MAILGPNGCGKSTLIKTITRDCYPQPADGAVCRIMGKSAWNIFELRSHLGVVSADLVNTNHRAITGRELVLSGFFASVGLWTNHHVSEEMQQTATTAMARLDTLHLAERRMNQLSSGEARRLLIARALIHDPQTLLLDEPTTSLDLTALQEVQRHLRALAQSGVGVILVTHHLDDIIPEIERVILLSEGKVYGDGAKSEVLTPATLSKMFRVTVKVEERNGFYHAW